MTVFHLTSLAFNGFVEFIFNDIGLLDRYEIHADLTETQQIYILKHLPREISEINKFKSETATITEVNQDITFDQFWNRYDEKIRSSKKKTMARWNKMSQGEQNRAYRFISKYESHILPGTAKKYAETYLTAELWAN
ncbi:MAG: hypothetical protein WCO44_12500 [Bacteroidota bacterium]